MRKHSKYEAAWRSRGGEEPAAVEAPPATVEQPSLIEPPPSAASSQAITQPIASIRAGYRDPSGIWHPAPDTRAYAKHLTDCTQCRKESESK